MRATSVLYLDSLDYQRDLFPSVASTALARMASAFAHVSKPASLKVFLTIARKS